MGREVGRSEPSFSLFPLFRHGPSLGRVCNLAFLTTEENGILGARFAKALISHLIQLDKSFSKHLYPTQRKKAPRS